MSTEALIGARPLNTSGALRALFRTNTLVFSAANGLLPLLPLYLRTRGLTPFVVGLVLATAYMAMACGVLLNARLSAAHQSRRHVTVAAGCGGLALCGLGLPLAPWALALLLIGAWACLGVLTATVNAAVTSWSWSAGHASAFSTVSLAAPLGALCGGLVLAFCVDRAGYEVAFIVAGCAWLAAPLCWPQRSAPGAAFSTIGLPPAGLHARLRPLIAVAVLLMSAVFAGRMAFSLRIDAAGLPVRAVGEVSALGGLVMLLLLPLIGRIADRVGQRRVLAALALSAALGCGLLAMAQQWALFALAGVLLAIAAYGAGAISCAYAAELAPPGGAGRAVMYVTAAFWGAAVVSFAGAGALADLLGLRALVMICAVLALAAAALLGRAPVAASAPRSALPASQGQAPPPTTTAPASARPVDRRPGR
jgi:MFS family permease